MTFIKFLKMCDKIRKRGGQSIVEYALLVGVAIIALLATNFLVNNFKRSGNAFEKFFNTTRYHIGGNLP